VNYFLQGCLNLQGGSSDSSFLMGDVKMGFTVLLFVSDSYLRLKIKLFLLASSFSVGTFNLPLGFSLSSLGHALSLLDLFLGSSLGCLGGGLIVMSMLLGSLPSFLGFQFGSSLGLFSNSLSLSSGSLCSTFGFADLPVGSSLGFLCLSLLFSGISFSSSLRTISFLSGHLTFSLGSCFNNLSFGLGS